MYMNRVAMASTLLSIVCGTDVGDEDALAEIGEGLTSRIRAELRNLPDEVNDALVVLQGVQQQIRVLQNRRLIAAMKTETRARLEAMLIAMKESQFEGSRQKQIMLLEKKIASMAYNAASPPEDAESSPARKRNRESGDSGRSLGDDGQVRSEVVVRKVDLEKLIDCIVPKKA